MRERERRENAFLPGNNRHVTVVLFPPVLLRDLLKACISRLLQCSCSLARARPPPQISLCAAAAASKASQISPCTTTTTLCVVAILFSEKEKAEDDDDEGFKCLLLQNIVGKTFCIRTQERFSVFLRPLSKNSNKPSSRNIISRLVMMPLRK